ncbi:MAG: V-type ATPase subunit, partial [Eubacteriaceae bacterium]|nr:V-type ATPase subunit [Eubacteriaceae bacterium]
MKRIQDVDYLYASTRIKALERTLVTNERLRRMAEAKSDDELLKVLDECGYGEINEISQIPAAIAKKRHDVIYDALQLAPDKKVVQIFLLRYDYHNLKAIIKGQAANTEYESTLMESGSIPVKQMMATAGNTIIGADGQLSSIMKQAANEARDLLARTGDPRLSDTVLDRACFAEMLMLAKEAESSFLVE